MSNYNRDSRSGGGRYGGGDYRGRDSRRREMHKAVCAECGADCEVPFRPSGDKPIYCSKCFEGKESGSYKRSDGRGPQRSDYGKSDDTNKQLLKQVSFLNEKLDRILKVIESNVDKKPVSKKTEIKKVAKKDISKDKNIKEKKASKKKAIKSTPKE